MLKMYEDPESPKWVVGGVVKIYAEPVLPKAKDGARLRPLVNRNRQKYKMGRV